MRLNEIARIDEEDIGTVGEAELIEAIRRDCKPFLDSRADGLMYRGMRSKPNRPFRQTVRSDRKPKNMDVTIHHAIDDWFEKRFGFRARSECVFVSGDYRDAKSYGPVYAVFPIGDFEFVWSPDVGDLFIMFHSKKKPEEVAETLDDMGYQNDNIKAAIRSDYEIMVKCNEYYAVPIEDWRQGEDFFKRLKGRG